MPELVTKRGDRRTNLRVQLQRGDGTYVKFSNESLTVADIFFHIRLGTSIRTANATAIDDDQNGGCYLTPTLDMVDTAGTADVEVELRHPDGRYETFPVTDPFTWRIVPDIA